MLISIFTNIMLRTLILVIDTLYSYSSSSKLSFTVIHNFVIYPKFIQDVLKLLHLWLVLRYLVVN